MEDEKLDAYAQRVKAILNTLEEQVSAFYATFGKDATIAMLKGLLKAARTLPSTPQFKFKERE